MDIKNTITRLLSIGLTQSEIGREIKRSQSTVCELAAGKYGASRPSADVVEGLKRLQKRHRSKLNSLLGIQCET
jgi:hypothetical protein